jgi:tripartite motif-containing protein 2/3/tripartite motif-containing protein 71
VHSLKAAGVEVSKQQEAIEADIHNSINSLHDAIDIRRTELLSELQRVSQSKLQSIEDQQSELEMSQVQLDSCQHYLSGNLEKTDVAEVMATKSSIMSQIQKLIAEFKPDMLKATTESNIAFSATPNAMEVIQKFGALTWKAPALLESVTAGEDEGKDSIAVLELEDCQEAVSLPDPSKCYIKGSSVEVAEVGEEFVAVLHVINSNMQLPKEPVETIACELVSDVTDSTVLGEVQMVALSQYEVRYRPVVKGVHHLHLKVNGEHIDGSPFPVTVKSPVSDLGTLIKDIQQLKGPWGVAVTGGGDIVVSAHDEHCVHVFKRSGEKIRSFGALGSKVAQFNCPRDVAIDGQGAVLVADYKNNRIQKFSVNGKFIQAAGSKGSGPLQFRGPKGIAFSSFNGMSYVVDENHHVQILTSDLRYYGSFGKLGSGKDQFNDPWGIACDSHGKVYVTDTTNHRIQIFAADGMFVGTIGGRGKSPGKFTFPAGIAIDCDNTLYVSERYNHRVSVFNFAGNFMTVFGKFGRGPGEMKYPRGLAVDSSGVVYVCDHDNSRISMY